MKYFFIILVSLSSLLYADFHREHGVVTDSLTRLQWQDNYSDNEEEIKQTAWIDAIDYCENLVLNAEHDWRLPHINELTSIIDYTRKTPAINPIFEYIASSNSTYWTSTTLDIPNNGSAWFVSFRIGYHHYGAGKRNFYNVRCVRAGE